MNIREGTSEIQKTKEQFGEQLPEMEETTEAGVETDGIIQSMELDGLDSDTQETASDVTEQYSEAYDEAMSEMEEQVEGTADTAQENAESLGENKEQVERNAERYAEAAGVSDLGRGAAESGRAKMESDSEAYSELIDENEQAIEDARERSRNLRSTVNGLFGG